MRVNVYSQELTTETMVIRKESNTGRVYLGAALMLHSSPMLHHPPKDDDRSAVTFWLPSSPDRCEAMARTFERIAAIFRAGQNQPAAGIPPAAESDQDRIIREFNESGGGYQD